MTLTDQQITQTIEQLAQESLRLAHPGQDRTQALFATALMQILVLLHEARAERQARQ